MTNIVEPVTIHLPCGGIARFIEYGSSAYQCETCGVKGMAGIDNDANPCALDKERYKRWEGEGEVEWTEGADLD